MSPETQHPGQRPDGAGPRPDAAETRPLGGRDEETRPLPGTPRDDRETRPLEGRDEGEEARPLEGPPVEAGPGDAPEPGVRRAGAQAPSDPTPTPDPASGPAPGAGLPDEGERFPLGTLVFGLVVVAVGLLLLATLTLDVTLEPGVVAVGLLVGAGLVLVVGGLVGGRQRRRP